MFTVSFSLIALALGAPASQEGDPQAEVAPGDPDARLAEALRAELSFVDPLRAGWESEAQGAAAQALLDELAAWMTGSGSAGEDFPAGLVAPDFLGGALRPAQLDPAFADAAFRVLRPAPGGTERGAQIQPAAAGPRGLAEALRRLHASFAGAPDRVRLKVTGVFEVDGGFGTRVRYEASGATRGPGGATVWIQQGASWTCRFRAESGAPTAGPVQPVLTEIESEGFEYVRSPSPLFADRTEALLGELEPDVGNVGVGDWRRRLDTRLGQPLLGHPAGIAIGDVDGNGLEDLYLCQPGGVPNQLLLRGRDGSLRNASRDSGTDFLEFSRSALILDLDADGDQDLVVVVADELVLLSQSNAAGRTRFEAVGSFPAVNTTSLAVADADLDGDLDLYTCSYFGPYAGGGTNPVPYHDANNGQPNVLLENRGDLEFVDVTAAVGLDQNNQRFSFSAAWEDYDRDGDPDLYVANDFGRNNLYRNEIAGAGGELRFEDVAAAAGVEDVSAGMGVAWGDYDGDGWYDLLVSNMYSSAGNRIAYQRNFRPEGSDDTRGDYQRHARGNSLFRNRGDGSFEDVSAAAGVSMGRWAWGSRFVDLNNDGRLDLLVPNGFLTQERYDDL